MKKLIFIGILNIVIASSIFAECHCKSNIKMDFNSLEQTIKNELNSQKQALTNLKLAIEKANEEVNRQNQKLDTEISLIKDEAIRDSELVFLLTQKNQLR